MITALVIVFFLGALICYSSCCVASRADRQSEEYYLLKMQEKETENLKKE